MNEALAHDVAALAALLRQGGWTELRIESDTVSVLLATDPAVPGLGGQVAAPATPGPSSSAPAAAAPLAVPDAAVEPQWTAVAAPNLGTFYRAPKPGAEPFVQLGDRVTADSEICLLEVMKLFTSVKAGVAGRIVRICTADAELVEGGRILFYIDPE